MTDVSPEVEVLSDRIGKFMDEQDFGIVEGADFMIGLSHFLLFELEKHGCLPSSERMDEFMGMIKAGMAVMEDG